MKIPTEVHCGLTLKIMENHGYVPARDRNENFLQLLPVASVSNASLPPVRNKKSDIEPTQKPRKLLIWFKFNNTSLILSKGCIWRELSKINPGYAWGNEVLRRLSAGYTLNFEVDWSNFSIIWPFTQSECRIFIQLFYSTAQEFYFENWTGLRWYNRLFVYCSLSMVAMREKYMGKIWKLFASEPSWKQRISKVSNGLNR